MIAYPIPPGRVFSRAIRPRLGYPSPLKGVACSRSPVGGRLPWRQDRGQEQNDIVQEHAGRDRRVGSFAQVVEHGILFAKEIGAKITAVTVTALCEQSFAAPHDDGVPFQQVRVQSAGAARAQGGLTSPRVCSHPAPQWLATSRPPAV
jgi:hypothetical protein